MVVGAGGRWTVGEREKDFEAAMQPTEHARVGAKCDQGQAKSVTAIFAGHWQDIPS